MRVPPDPRLLCTHTLPGSHLVQVGQLCSPPTAAPALALYLLAGLLLLLHRGLSGMPGGGGRLGLPFKRKGAWKPGGAC